MKGEPELPEGWVDWNQLSMDVYVEHLKDKFMVDSSGTAKAVFELIRFYEVHKNCKHEPKSNS